MAPRSAADRPVTGPEGLAWIPAASVYFDDLDRPSQEFIAMLPEAPRPELDRIPSSQWLVSH